MGSARVPRKASDLLVSLGAAIGTLSQQLCRAPTVTEIADSLRVTDDDVLGALEARQAYRMQSLAATAPDENRAGRRWAAVEDEHLDATRLTMRIAVAELPEDDQRIVYLRFYEGLTQAEIASRLGTSQVQISRRLRRDDRRLESELEPGVVDTVA